MKKIKLLALMAVGIGLMSGCNANTNGVQTKSVSDRLAFQTTTSLVALDSMNVASPSVLAKKLDVDEATKKEVEKLLPTLSLIVENDKNFQSEIINNTDAGKENFKFKQTITLTDLSGKTIQYILYYNLLSDENTDNVIDALPETKDELNNDSSSTLNARFKDEENKDSESEKDDDEEDEKEENDDDDLDRNGLEKTTTTVFNGIALKDDQEFPFEARSTEEVEDEESEKVFALRMFDSTDNKKNYMDVIYEIEQEENEIEKNYTYRFVENGLTVDEFEIELESEVENNILENEIEIKIGQKEMEFKLVTEKDGKDHIYVEVENDDEEYKTLHYVKVISEDKTVTYQEIIEE